MSRNNSVVFTLCLSTTGIGYRYQSLLTVCNLEEVREGVHVLKVLKQKLLVDGVEYLLQEIYGLENKKTQPQVCLNLNSLQFLTIIVLSSLLSCLSQGSSHQRQRAPMMMMMTMMMMMKRILVLSV